MGTRLYATPLVIEYGYIGDRTFTTSGRRRRKRCRDHDSYEGMSGLSPSFCDGHGGFDDEDDDGDDD